MSPSFKAYRVYRETPDATRMHLITMERARYARSADTKKEGVRHEVA
jgi:hypothetical protein